MEKCTGHSVTLHTCQIKQSINNWTRELLKIGGHELARYGNPSPELLQYAKASGIEIKIFSFLQGL